MTENLEESVLNPDGNRIYLDRKTKSVKAILYSPLDIDSDLNSLSPYDGYRFIRSILDGWL